MKKKITKFLNRLGKFRFYRQCGLLLCELVRVAGIAGVVLALYVFLDYFLAFPQAELRFLNTLLAALLVVYFLIRAVRILGMSLRGTASALDRVAGHTRQQLLGAYELGLDMRSRAAASEMSSFLMERVLTDAEKLLDKLPLRRIFPSAEFRRQISVFAVQALAVVLLLGIPYRISSVILDRIFHPSSDIPPYSLYHFAVSPAEPSVVYGGNLELSAVISGAPVRGTVSLKIRQGGKHNSTACFKDGEDKYVQRIEKLTAPVEFCFSIGRYRSRWHSVEVLMIPQIALAEIDVTPPSYTHMPSKHFILGRDTLDVLENAGVSLTVTSNRPLNAGSMTIISRDGKQKIVRSEKAGPNSVKFSWKADALADISVRIADIRGTESDKPLKFRQSIVPDRLPDVVITEPDPFILATPDAKIMLRGYADDDFGLKRVDFVRSVIGYRDRLKHLGPAIAVRRYGFEREIDLKAIGVLPGEIMELYAEAEDFNPSLMGVAASDVVKIKIISKEEYAELLRTRTKVDTIFRRHAAMKRAFRELKKALDKFRKQLDSEKIDEKTKKERIAELKKANSSASETLLRLVKDFPIYDMEKEQRETFKELRRQTLDNENIIDSMTPSDTENTLSEKVDTMLAAFKKAQEKIAKMDQNMAELQALYAVMELAARYVALIRKQEETVRRMSRFELNRDLRESAMLVRLGEREKELADELEKFSKELIERSDKLPPKWKILRDDSYAFVERLKSYRIIPELEKADNSASRRMGNSAYLHAQKALELMKRLIDKKNTPNNTFAKMCRGEMPGNGKGSGSGQGGGRGVGRTAQQMLRSLLKKQSGQGYGKGQGRGQGTGSAGMGGEGNANDGYSMNNSSMLNVPLAGPKRSTYSKDGGKSGSGKNGRGPGKARSVKISSDARENISVKEQQTTETESISFEDAPFKYRNAVKKYFSEEEQE